MPVVIEQERPWALITGATGGLGLQFCQLLAARGYRLVITGRNARKLSQIRKEIPQAELALAGDLTDPVCLKNLIAHLKRDGIEPEVLINNAGFGLYGKASEYSTEDNLNVIDLNIRSLTFLTLELPKAMREKHRGFILNVASIAAFMPCPYLGVYGATKSYVLSFSEALREEFKDEGVNVTALCPGPVKTGFWDRAGVETPDQFDFAFTHAREVAECGLRALFAGRAVAVYGVINKILVWSAQIAPRPLVRLIAKRVLRSVQGKVELTSKS